MKVFHIAKLNSFTSSIRCHDLCLHETFMVSNLNIRSASDWQAKKHLFLGTWAWVFCAESLFRIWKVPNKWDFSTVWKTLKVWCHMSWSFDLKLIIKKPTKLGRKQVDPWYPLYKIPSTPPNPCLSSRNSCLCSGKYWKTKTLWWKRNNH